MYSKNPAKSNRSRYYNDAGGKTFGGDGCQSAAAVRQSQSPNNPAAVSAILTSAKIPNTEAPLPLMAEYMAPAAVMRFFMSAIAGRRGNMACSKSLVCRLLPFHCVAASIKVFRQSATSGRVRVVTAA